MTYHLKESLESRHETRRKTERELAAKGESVTIPSWDELREADLEEAPFIVVSVEDASGAVVRRIAAPSTAGIHRVAWDLRWPSLEPIDLGATRPMNGDTSKTVDRWWRPGPTPFVSQKRVDGVLTQIGEAQTFEAVPLGIASLPASDRQALAEFHRRAAELQRAVLATVEVVKETRTALAALSAAIDATPGIDDAAGADVRSCGCGWPTSRWSSSAMQPSASAGSRSRHPPSIGFRRVMEAHWSSSSAATTTHKRNYEIASDALTEILVDLRPLVEVDLVALQQKVESAGGPWTPGSGLPTWPPVD